MARHARRGGHSSSVRSRHPARRPRSGAPGAGRSDCDLLVMQPLDNSITVLHQAGPHRPAQADLTQGHGAPNPNWIPVCERGRAAPAEEIDGVPLRNRDDLFNVPMTAHFIGGCAIGDSATPGSSIRTTASTATPAARRRRLGDLGQPRRQPSLTITAQAERAMALWPNNGEQTAATTRKPVPADRLRHPHRPSSRPQRPVHYG